MRQAKFDSINYAVILSAIAVVSGCGQPDAGSTNAQSAASSSNSDDSSPPADPEKTAESSQSVELQILDFDAYQELVASKRGKPTIVDCWSTACAPCLKEFPGLVRLHQKYGDRVACISLSFDYDGGASSPEDVQGKVLGFLKSKNASFDNVLSSTPSDELSKKIGIAGSIPVVLVFDAEGNLAKKFNNDEAETDDDYFTYDDVEAMVDGLLGK
jgi:thiol-disulfide isomerase/thioredoxin